MENFKVLKYESEDFPGYSYIKLYNKNANKENMINEIKSMDCSEKYRDRIMYVE